MDPMSERSHASNRLCTPQPPAFPVIHHFVYQPIFAATVLLGQVPESRLQISIVLRKHLRCSGARRPSDAISFNELDEVVALDENVSVVWSRTREGPSVCPSS